MEKKDNPTPEAASPDKGKVGEKESVFVCQEDCFTRGIRYLRGQEIKGVTCPPHFKIKDFKK